MIFWSASTGLFYHAAIHGDAVPGDALKVTADRHAELMVGQGCGRTIVLGLNGKPALSSQPKPNVAALRAFAIADIKAEARRRILAIASLERQANDNAIFALHALNMASGDEFNTAWTRRCAIDEVRERSNALEAKVSTWSAAALSQFDPADTAHWPVGA